MRHKHRVLQYWMLKSMGACCEQRTLFKEVFGYKVTVNKKNLIKAQLSGLDVMWAMRQLIGYENKNELNYIWDKCYQKYATNLNYQMSDLWNEVFDYFLPIFEQQTSYYWSEAPF